MRAKRINGTDFEKMLKNGHANLKMHEEEVNKLNVFPVPDGDTGTNMRMTLEHGIRSAKSDPHVGAYLKGISDGMLLGARGNSGVILSQIFRGIYLALARGSSINAGDMRNAMIRGYREGYAAVLKPVEGTILTVSREGVENIRTQITRQTTVDTFLSMYAAEMRKSLMNTPELLPVLKEAGVVDSGALGYILIVEGMIKYLFGEELEFKPALSEGEEELPVDNVDDSLFNENSVFEDGYCLTFLLQLMKGAQYNQKFKLDQFIDDLSALGNSIVAVQNDRRVKVHVHSMKPHRIIRAAQEYGEFISMKIDNMQIQHNEHDTVVVKKTEHKVLSIVAVTNGAGMRKTYEELGCDCVLEGGATMNTSSKEFLDAFSKLDCDHIVVLPNNKNIRLAAEQATKLYKGVPVTVLPTVSTVQGYYTIAMDIQDSADIQKRIRSMQNGMEALQTVAVTRATRDYQANGISCREGEVIGLLNGEVVTAGGDFPDAIMEAMQQIEGIEDKENCLIFVGCDVDESLKDEIEARISDLCPFAEVTFMDGGQPVYSWLVGIS
ncbi:MAG: DAK2 domain-containing protein [Lachnospiraceae bacterium]|nr:DAK2 domain-containing protein [Lachnospiraceae bacterium]